MLRERIELSTSPLPRVCSTTELPQHLIPERRVGVSGEAGCLLPHVLRRRKRWGASFFEKFSTLSWRRVLRYGLCFIFNDARRGRGDDVRRRRDRRQGRDARCGIAQAGQGGVAAREGSGKEAARRCASGQSHAAQGAVAGAARGEADERDEGLPGAGLPIPRINNGAGRDAGVLRIAREVAPSTLRAIRGLPGFEQQISLTRASSLSKRQDPALNHPQSGWKPCVRLAEGALLAAFLEGAAPLGYGDRHI